MALFSSGSIWLRISDDEIVVLHEECKKLSQDEKLQKKLQDDYRYQCNKNKKLFKSTGFDSKGNKCITVKACYFYSWFLNRHDKEYPEISLDNIPKKYIANVTVADFTLQLRLTDEIEESNDIEQVKEAYRILREENKQLKIQLQRKKEVNKKRGRRTI